MVTYKLQKENGTYRTEPILSSGEWLSVLHAADKKQRRSWLDVLQMFLYQPGHKAPCSRIGKEYSMDATAINSRIVHFCQFAQKVSGKEFRVEDFDQPTESYWPIAMYGRYLKGNLFEWELRPELVSALQDFLLKKLLEAYRGPVLEEGLDNKRSFELYKWRLLTSSAGKSTEEILGFMAGRSSEMNFITWRTQDALKGALKEHHKEIVDCFSLLLSEGDFYSKYYKFVEFGKTFLSKTEVERILKENEASVFLACHNPKENAVYKWALYKDACNYLGIDTKEARPIDGYMAILQRIIELENQDKELIEKLKSETAPYFWSELLNAQDVLYQMRLFMQTSRPKNWLQQIYDEAIRTNDGVFSWWYPKYRGSVQLFLEMFEDGKTAEDIPEDTIDFYIRAQQNYICNNGQGCITKEEYPKILQMWPQLYSILKRNVDSGEINPSDFSEMEKMIRPALKMKRPLAYHRLWSALFPEKLTTCCKDADFNYAYDTVRKLDSTLPQRTGRWLEDNLTLMDYLGKKVTYIEPWHRPLFARFLYDNLSAEENTSNMEKYIELLKANKNLVLTGAPGTGKTYLAKQIARALGDDNPGFVQFHPSYDYTDFVEGLRPTDDNHFERTNGIFKQFCTEALSHVKAADFDKAFDALLSDLGEMDEPLKLTTPNGGATFAISPNKRGNLNLHTGTEFTKQGTLTRENIRAQMGGEKVYNYWKGYFEGVVKILKEKYGLTETIPSEKPGDRVFIIDEINRGELAKIFGELFYAMEPTYRGEKGRIKTQYQNLVEPGDPFEKGFYVPENVYIIGTMNDIDRGVESMDFAIRRRFAWVEVKAEDRVAMLDAEIPDWSEEAKARMFSLNAALKTPEIGLSDAYDIGPAYFLYLDDKRYNGDFNKLWEYHIKGVLQEYLRGTRGIEDKMKILKEAFDNPKDKNND